VSGEDGVGVPIDVIAGASYRMVVRGFECRAATCTSRRHTPAMRRGEKAPPIPAAESVRTVRDQTLQSRQNG
jgi:hypothetical protein